MNNPLIETIKDEIAVCDRTLRETYVEARKLDERTANYNDRKIVLMELLEKAEAEAKERDNHD